MPNMEELLSRISRKISEGTEGEILAAKLYLDYAYRQIKLDEKKTRNLCIFTVTGDEFTGNYRFLQGFHGLADIPTIFQERIDTTLEHKNPTWLHDILIITKGNKEKHEAEMSETMTKLEKAGYRLNRKKWEFFKKESQWVGHKTDQPGIRPLQDKLDAITKINIPKNGKELKSLPWTGKNWNRYNTYIENLSRNRYIAKSIQEAKRPDLDGETRKSIQ